MRDRDREDARLEPVLRVAAGCRYEREHSHQVIHLALRLFDELRSLHGLGEKERFWLHCAGLLHDIGFCEGQKGHHRTALRIILQTSVLPFDERERQVIGSVARYHRKALPARKHAHFAALKPRDQRVVRVLAALLRVADGLDRRHLSVVRDITCQIEAKRIVLWCDVDEPAEMERAFALKKGRLFEQVFRRQLVIEWRTG